MQDTPQHPLDVERYHPDELRPYHRNPRLGDVEAIARSLEVNGQYRPIVVNLGRHTGRPLEVLAGNHTLAAARQLGWGQIAATTVDVDDHQAARIVAADNRTADLGDYNTDVLVGLLQELDGLEGTGYDDDTLEDMLAHLNPASLDELEDEYGEPEEDDLWPTISFKAPRELADAWAQQVDDHNGEVPALRHLLGLS